MSARVSGLAFNNVAAEAAFGKFIFAAHVVTLDVPFVFRFLSVVSSEALQGEPPHGHDQGRGQVDLAKVDEGRP